MDAIESKGMSFIGRDEAGERMIIMELKSKELNQLLLDHPFYVATQFHPEYKTRPLTPTPVFLGFVLASCSMLTSYLEKV